MFFFFSIAMSVCSVLLTMLVIRMELKAEIKPLQAMPRWVSWIRCKRSHENFSTSFEKYEYSCTKYACI